MNNDVYFGTVVAGGMTNISQGQKAVIKLAGDETLYDLQLYCKNAGAYLTEANIETYVDYVEVTMSDRVQGQGIKLVDQIPASELNALYKFHTAARSGYTLTGGIFIPFRRLGLGALPVGRRDAIKDVVVEVMLKDVALSLDEIEVRYTTDHQVMSLGPHMEITSFDTDYDSQSVQTLRCIDYGMIEPTAYSALHITPGAGQLANVTVNRKESAKVKYDIFKEQDPTMNNRFLHEAGKTPQADFFSLDFNAFGEPLRVDKAKCSQLTVQGDWSAGGAAPGNYRVIAEMIKGIQYGNEIVKA